MINSLKAHQLTSEGLYPQSKSADPAIRKLALGILLQAFRDIVTPHRSPSKEQLEWRTDALEWFYSDELYPGSMKWVCDILRMDVDELRTWLDGFKTSDKKQREKLVRKVVNFRMPKG